MSLCDEYRVKLLGYLDNELTAQELDDFRAHLEECPNCRASVEAEQALSRLLRETRPLYSAPDTLRERVSAAVEHWALPVHSGGSYHRRILQRLEKGLADPARRVARLRLLAATLAVTALFLAFAPNIARQARASNYVEAAIATHRGFLDGSLPLEFQSNSPEQVTAWLTGKVPFAFRLPKSQSDRDSIPPYRLIGASVVKYRGSPAALVTYEKQKEKISLLVASADSAVVAGGDEVRSGNLTFHYRTDQGFNVVTWTNHGLSYAVVSSMAGSARESCIICHQDMSDRNNFTGR
jgi:mycothiol system anti-sigma-R factor